MFQEKLAILLPVFNEENTIIEVIRNIKKTHLPCCIVNDGSTDSTNKILKWFNKVNGFTVIGYKTNRGKGYAVKYGAQELINQGYEWILIMDSDNQNDIEDISQFQIALKNHSDAKIFLGDRLHNSQNMPRVRYYTNRCMSWIISLLAGQKIIDSQCGYRLIHKSVFNIPLKSNRFEFESEMLIKASWVNMKIINVPVKCIYEEKRKSKINPIKDTIRFFQMLSKLFA